MDFFNTKKLAALEARIVALEPKAEEYVEASALTLQSLDKRVKEIEAEVMPQYFTINRFRSIFDSFLEDAKPEKLTLRRKVERLCEHLKIQFVTEPQRTVLKPVKQSKK